MTTCAARIAAQRRLEHDILTAEILAGAATDYALDEVVALRTIATDMRCSAAQRAAARAMLTARHPAVGKSAPGGHPRPGTGNTPRSTTWADLPEARRPPDELAGYGAPTRPIMPVTEAARAEARRALGVHRLPWESQEEP